MHGHSAELSRHAEIMLRGHQLPRNIPKKQIYDYILQCGCNIGAYWRLLGVGWVEGRRRVASGRGTITRVRRRIGHITPKEDQIHSRIEERSTTLSSINIRKQYIGLLNLNASPPAGYTLTATEPVRAGVEMWL